MDYRNLCRKCGGHQGAECPCGGSPQASGRKEDIDARAACAEATGLPCPAAATLGPREVVVARSGVGLAILSASGKHERIVPEEVLPPEYEVEVRERFTLEISPDDGCLREALEDAGWRVGLSRVRRRNDILERLAMLDAAESATGKRCVSVVEIVDESGQPFAAAVVAEPDCGALCLLDDMGYGVLPPDGLTVSLPDDDRDLAARLDAAGYAVLGFAAGKELVLTYAECGQPTHRAFAKVLTATDTGENGTNQSGPCIPAAVRGVLPYPLPRGEWPSASVGVMLDVVGYGGSVHETAPARVISHTRGRARPIETHLTGFMKHIDVNAREGDIMVVERTMENRYSLSFHREGTEEHAAWLGTLRGKRFGIVA